MAAQIPWVKGQEKDVLSVNDKQGTQIFSTPDIYTVLKVTKIKSIKIEDKDYVVTAYLTPHEDNGRGVVHGIDPRGTIEELTEAFGNPRNPPILGVRKMGNYSSAIVTFKNETVPRGRSDSFPRLRQRQEGKKQHKAEPGNSGTSGSAVVNNPARVAEQKGGLGRQGLPG
ncbi:hypothetical protein HPB49_024542 [Dermacentor silvarum]|uniref:Uncharacterized protein n=1 Tax=Dermacentor silvarum TaxID=543639 RepID=A0ACB8D0W7_DERSI|nr:hypothetical protein HPB49_024542 [Dermacentor silvarum]